MQLAEARRMARPKPVPSPGGVPVSVRRKNDSKMRVVVQVDSRAIGRHSTLPGHPLTGSQPRSGPFRVVNCGVSPAEILSPCLIAFTSADMQLGSTCWSTVRVLFDSGFVKAP